MADNEEGLVEPEHRVWIKTRRGGSSWQRKMRRETRIREQIAQELQREADACLKLPCTRMSEAEQTELLLEWEAGSLEVPPQYDPELRQAEPSADEV